MTQRYFGCMEAAAARRWLRRLLEIEYAWIIETGTLIGQIRLESVDLRDRRANLLVGIEDSAQLGKGLGTEAIILVLGYAFNILKLHRLSLRVVEYNLRANTRRYSDKEHDRSLSKCERLTTSNCFPLCPNELTSVCNVGRSVRSHLRTHAPQQSRERFNDSRLVAPNRTLLT
jgi:hypothetical protein